MKQYLIVVKRYIAHCRAYYANRYLYYILLTVGSLFLGIIFLFFKRDWLVVHWVPGYDRCDVVSSVSGKHVVQRKEILMWYWDGEKVKKERDVVVWRGDKASNVQVAVGEWLSFLYEERILARRIGLESVAFSGNRQDLFLSFDHSLLAPEWSIHRKWQVLDGLCRTIAGLGLGVQSVMFLVNHEKMTDDHLDFSQSWPIF